MAQSWFCPYLLLLLLLFFLSEKFWHVICHVITRASFALHRHAIPQNQLWLHTNWKSTLTIHQLKINSDYTPTENQLWLHTNSKSTLTTHQIKINSDYTPTENQLWLYTNSKSTLTTHQLKINSDYTPTQNQLWLHTNSKSITVHINTFCTFKILAATILGGCEMTLLHHFWQWPVFVFSVILTQMSNSVSKHDRSICTINLMWSNPPFWARTNPQLQ